MSTVEDLRKRFEALGDDEDVAMKQLILEVSSSIHIHTPPHMIQNHNIVALSY